MCVFIGKLIAPMLNPKMLLMPHIHQAIVSAPII